MFAADPVPIAVSAETDTQSGVIEVIGQRIGEALKIDRRTYRVNRNPHSAQADTIDLLRGIPAVTIAPDGTILLLGSAYVTILVDDRPPHGNPLQFLHTLHGSDIERIEIITNPSAQYSPQGSGGIINVVLKKLGRDELQGYASGEASSLGRGEASSSLKMKRGQWTYEFLAMGNSGKTSHSTYRKDRIVKQDPTGRAVNIVEEGSGSSYLTSGTMSAKATRAVNDKTDISAAAYANLFRDRSSNRFLIDARGPVQASYTGREQSRDRNSSVGGEIALERRGSRAGESLKARAALSYVPERRQRTKADSDDGHEFSVIRSARDKNVDAQVDWNRVMGKGQILSMGARWTFQDTDRTYEFTEDGADFLQPNNLSRYEGRIRTTSAYMTLQEQFGDWKVMPGLRVERYSRRISSPGLPSSSLARTKVFPTFHIEKSLGKSLNLTVSYSKRIDRPDVDQLRPYPIVLSHDTISIGNPALLDQSTDAYEANLYYSRGNVSAGLIVYSRATQRSWASTYSVNNSGINLVTPINTGRSADRGAEFDINTPLARHLKATASLNLFESRVATDPAVGKRHADSFRFTANGTLEWNRPARRRTPGDTAQLQVTYDSPWQGYQTRYRGRYSLNMSYTHNLSPTVSLSGSIKGIGERHSRHVLNAPLVEEIYDRRARVPEFKIKLMKIFTRAK